MSTDKSRSDVHRSDVPFLSRSTRSAMRSAASRTRILVTALFLSTLVTSCSSSGPAASTDSDSVVAVAGGGSEFIGTWTSQEQHGTAVLNIVQDGSVFVIDYTDPPSDNFSETDYRTLTGSYVDGRIVLADFGVEIAYLASSDSLLLSGSEYVRS